MLKTIYRSILMTLILTVILCGIYPLAVFVVGKVIFPNQSTGGIVLKDGVPVGAELIGQNFSKAEYFHGRPSAAGNNGYDAANSSGSNLGPTNKKLLSGVEANVKKIRDENPDQGNRPVPVDLVTASASGLDPHLSVEGARFQIARVAKARDLNNEQVGGIVDRNVEKRQLGFLGEPVVNVLKLNMELDRLAPIHH